MSKLRHLVARARYLVARSKKAAAGFTTAVVAGVAAYEGVDPSTAGETTLTAAIIGLATALGVWIAPKNERHADELDDSELHQ